jgi:Tol biopolymer transport system component
MSAERREDPLASIIDAILDGRAAEWPDGEASEGLSPDDQRALEPLRVLAAIASVQSPLGLSTLDDHGRFELRERIGEGASGAVYLARDKRLDRDVALKIVPLDRPFAGSVLAEARRLARVRHANVVTVFDVYETPLEGRICMELLSGPTLAQMMEAHRRLPVPDVLQIGRCVARALGAIHNAGLVHGDIKPSNVVVEESGRVVVMDFGAGTDLTRGSRFVRAGTPRYMAPEVMAGAPARPESDLFSLGMLLYYLLEGRHASPDVSRGASGKAPAGAAAGSRHLPAPFSDVIARAVQPDPAARFRSAAELESALVMPVRTSRQAILASLLICVCLLCGVAWSARHQGASSHGRVVEHQLPVQVGMGAGDLLDDGSLMTFTVRGGVAVLDIGSGESRSLVAAGRDGSAIDAVLVRSDDRTAVFGWRLASCDCVELRSVPLDGGVPRPLLRTPFAALELLSLSGDGTLALLATPLLGRDPRLVVADLVRGTLTDGIATSAAMRSADLSPDGRFIALDLEQDDGHGDLFIADVGSGRTWPILQGAADDLIPRWTKDGRSVVFASDRAGSPGLWRLVLEDGQPVAGPTLVERDLGRFIPLRLTASGSMSFYRTPVTDIEVATFDPLTGQAGRPAPLPVRITGSNTAPCWTATGESLVYASERRALGARRSLLVVHSWASGRERELTLPVAGLLEPACSPVSNHVLIRGPGVLDGVRGGRVVDLDTGSITAVFPFPLSDQKWAPDGQSFFALDDLGIHRVDLRTGSRSRVNMGAWKPVSFALSPEGTRIAASASQGDVHAVVIGSSGGGTAEVLHRFEAPGLLPRGLQWTPDGARLLGVVPADRDDPAKQRLVTIGVDGGEIDDAGLERHGLYWVRLRPDGRQIAYRTGHYRRTLWLREHFLPSDSER